MCTMADKLDHQGKEREYAARGTCWVKILELLSSSLSIQDVAVFMAGLGRSVGRELLQERVPQLSKEERYSLL